MFGYIDVDKEITGNYGKDGCGEEVVACSCEELSAKTVWRNSQR